MAYTKRDLLRQAFSSLGLGSYYYDLTAEDLQEGLNLMDGMMAMWDGNGIRLGYPLPDSPGTSNLDDATNVPDWALQAVSFNVAICIAPSYGKEPAREVKRTAKQAMIPIQNILAMPNPTKIDVRIAPAGAGHKRDRWTGSPFLTPPEDTIDAGPDSEIEF